MMVRISNCDITNLASLWPLKANVETASPVTNFLLHLHQKCRRTIGHQPSRLTRTPFAPQLAASLDGALICEIAPPSRPLFQLAAPGEIILSAAVRNS